MTANLYRSFRKIILAYSVRPYMTIPMKGYRIKEAKRLAVKDVRRLVLNSEPWKSLNFTEADVKAIARTSESANLLVAFDDERIIGFTLSIPNFLRGEYLQLLSVDADFRSRGVGQALMKALEAKVFAKSPNLFLCVSDFNEKARAFYQKLGYEVVGSLDDFLVEGKAELLMRKTIGPARRS